ncbi:MAG: hypothetical protein P4L49_10545 [Desulfosporosinus sp.]|nr:hypothetical protein [Desulfosporosinus sp.]
MICDRIVYGGQSLLTVYHQGFDDEIKERRLKIVEKVGAYKLVFTETLVSDDELDNITNWSIKEEGLLTPDSTKNPYGEAACAYMIHYEYANKPLRIFNFSGDRYFLRIPVDKLIQINEFVKKYTGLDIDKNPMNYGDIFVYRSFACNYRANKEEGIVVESLPAGSTVIVRFKKSDIIVSTKVVRIDHETEETEIKAGKPWTYHDIEIFFDDELVYYRKDLSYIRRMQINMQIKEPQKRIRLNKIANSYAFERNGSGHVSNIGDPLEEYEEMMNASASEIKKRLNVEKADDQVTFMKPGEIQKAIDLIGSVMQTASDTIWIFDSYFTDVNGIKGMLDWIRILANCPAQSKNVTFYSKGPNNALDLVALKKEIERDAELGIILRTRNALGIHFYQTKSPIHDRFVLTETDKIYSGLAIGTSFNSLGDHYYCVFKLSHKASQTIWNELESWTINSNNLIKDEEV